jgi:hypothetical protein
VASTEIREILLKAPEWFTPWFTPLEEKVATRYPKSGKGRLWTIRELQAITAEWKGDTVSDGGGLIGEIRTSDDGKVSIRFKYAFK